ncbi:MAG: terpene synthase [Anaerovoracaceae bacterium]
MENCWGSDVPTVSTCSFRTTGSGILVYDKHGKVVGFYETEDAAVEVLRDRENKEGGVDDEI